MLVAHTTRTAPSQSTWMSPYTHTLFLVMKKIPWWSLLLEEVHNSLVIAETCLLTFENILARHLQATGFSNEEEILVK